MNATQFRGHGAAQDDLQDPTLDLHAALLPLIHLFLTTRLDSFRMLCEIGCGSGRLLRDCTERLPSFRDYVGLDPRRKWIEHNRSVYRDLRLRFECALLREWLPVGSVPGTLLLTDSAHLTADDVCHVLPMWVALRPSLKPIALALAVPAPTSGARHDLALIDQVGSHARVVHHMVEVRVGHLSVRLIVAEF